MSCSTPICSPPPTAVRPATAHPPRRPHARSRRPLPRTASWSRCAACGAPWRKACRCRAIKWPAAPCATMRTFTTGRSAADYMLRLMRAMICAWRAEPALNAWYDAATHSRFLVATCRFRHRRRYARRPHRSGGAQHREQVARGTARRHRAAKGRGSPAQHRRPRTCATSRCMLSNFGTLAGRYGIPLVVPPAVAILGAGKVREDAVVVGGAWCARIGACRCP